MRNEKTILWFATILGVVLLASACAAETVAEDRAVEQPTVETIQAALKQIDQAQGVDEPSKVKAKEHLSQALQDVEATGSWTAKIERFTQMAATAPEEISQVRADLAALSASPEPAIPDGSLLQLEQALSKKEAELSERRALLAELEAEPKRRAGRRVEIPKLAAGLQERLAEVDRQLQAPSAGGPAPALAARRTALWARRQSIERELLSNERELGAYEVRGELLALRRDLVARQIAQAEQELLKWRESVNRQRHRESEAQLRRARREADRAHPAVERLAQANARLTERRQEMARLIAEATRDLEQASGRLAALQDQFTRTQEKVDTVGLTNAIGLLLRKQRESLPDVRNYRQRINARQATIRQCQLELLELEDRRSELAKLDRQVEAELRAVGRPAHPVDRTELEASIREFLDSEKDYLDALKVDANSYFDKLVDLDAAERQLVEQAQQYSKYIGERVLWIRSAAAFGVDELLHLGEGLAWLARPQGWIDLGRALWADGLADPLPAALALVVFGSLFYGHRPLRRKVAAIGEAAGRATCCHLGPTVEAIALTLLIALVWPGLLGYVAWRLHADGNGPDLFKAVAAGLSYVAGVYLVLELLRQMCRENGLFDAHFGWPDPSLQGLRRYTRWTMFVLLPLVFVTVAISSQANERWADSLGRFSFMAVMSICGLMLGRALRSTGGISKGILASRQTEWVARARIVWYPLVVSVPVALAVLAAAGYYYTAQQLAQRMVATAYVLLGLTLLRSFLLRWVLVRRRKLAIEQARIRRAAAWMEGKTGGESAVMSGVAPATEPQIDLAAINQQSRHLVEYSLAVTGLLGVWLVWVDVLPALGFLDRVVLWETLDPANPITLADLGLSLLIFATTLIAAKNVPGLIEMVLLQHLPFDAGFRYTVESVSRYLIIVVGAVFGFQTLGLGWAKVQWLVAAVSVGLGFGLQEIFANFVSGLIILFERPVRVGDVVTVADVTGVISRIRMRATTITNWDRKEFIVPNKEFITGRLLNWTLTDPVNRVVVNVGIAYGSDTERAAQLLAEAAQEHPCVLDDPAPRVTFEEFGDSSLQFVLRCYLPDLENRLSVIHDLHMAVDRKFREAGIEIAFPQHDVHVRSIDAALQLAGDRLPRVGTPQVAPDDRDRHEATRQVA